MSEAVIRRYMLNIYTYINSTLAARAFAELLASYWVFYRVRKPCSPHLRCSWFSKTTISVISVSALLFGQPFVKSKWWSIIHHQAPWLPTANNSIRQDLALTRMQSGPTKHTNDCQTRVQNEIPYQLIWSFLMPISLEEYVAGWCSKSAHCTLLRLWSCTTECVS